MLSVCAIGEKKPKMGLTANIIMAFLAGAYIGFGSLLAIKVAATIPVEIWGNLTRLIFGAVFPVGLLLVLVAGADLFTGNCMYLPSAIKHRKATWGGLFRSWFVSYGGNFIGSVAVAFFLGYMSGILFTDGTDGLKGTLPLAEYAVKLANGKTALAFDVAFIRGIGCNWLVCLAIYVSLTASDGVSKVVLLWPPITAFVALGFEHSVANMTFIPLGIFLGTSDVYLASASASLVPLTATWYDFFVTNLIPVTLGNIIGGWVFVSMFYYKATGTKAE